MKALKDLTLDPRVEVLEHDYGVEVHVLNAARTFRDAHLGSWSNHSSFGYVVDIFDPGNVFEHQDDRRGWEERVAEAASLWFFGEQLAKGGPR